MPLPLIVPPTISRYMVLSFITMTVAWLVALALGKWGVTAPVIFGLAGGVLSVHLPALLFVKTHRREFFPEEELPFIAGSFSAVWFYDQLPSLVAHMLNHASWNLVDVLRFITATGVDLVLVCFMVFYTVPFAAWLLFLRTDTASPPNNRWRGP